MARKRDREKQKKMDKKYRGEMDRDVENLLV